MKKKTALTGFYCAKCRKQGIWQTPDINTAKKLSEKDGWTFSKSKSYCPECSLKHKSRLARKFSPPRPAARKPLPIEFTYPVFKSS